MNTVTPLDLKIPWWQRYQAEIEIGIKLTPGTMTIREWLFAPEAALTREYRGYQCFWLRGSIRVLGVFIGAAIFRRGSKIEQRN